MEFPYLGVVDRWLTTPKRARIAHSSLSRDRRINMQLTNKLTRCVEARGCGGGSRSVGKCGEVCWSVE